MSIDFEQLGGWVDDPVSVGEVLGRQDMPLYGPAAAMSQTRGIGAGKRVLLYQAIYKTLGGPQNYNTRLQGIGDCVSMGGARAVDILRAIQVVSGNGSWRGETATEVLYAFGRIEVGGGRLGNSDGSVGAWQADACKRYGTLIRAVYGQYDLTTYSAQRAREWGAPGRGVPDALEPTAREHLVRTVSLVTTWEELCDAIASGYPVTVASNQGFTKVRDSQGFARASGNWPHQMCFIGVDDLSARKGACIDNSWGDNWISGPRTYEQPKGSFWVDKATVESMLRAQDSWAYSDYVGFPAKKLHFGDIF